MDNPVVNTPREEPPAWARSKADHGAMASKITPPQRKFLLDLIAKKNHGLSEGKLDQVLKAIRISEDPEEFGLSKSKASELIEWFLSKPDRPKDTTAQGWGHINGTPLAELPAGRYALPKSGTTEADNEIRFYQCWESRNKEAKRLYVMFGPYESRLPSKAQQDIAAKILADGVRKCAIRYGLEIGECSNCGRRLTNRISRELGIGPVCGGRMFGETWSAEVKQARAEIVARGDDPDEEME